MKTLIQGGTVVNERGAVRQDLLLEGGKIVWMGTDCPDQGAQTEDARGLLVLPGMIDAHTHMDLPVCGTVTADDFQTGTQAALLGGTTCLVDFATQEKGETLSQGLQNWREKAQGKSSCDYGFHMAISEWTPEIARELPEMFREGITSFKVYLTYANQVNDRELYEVLTALKAQGGLLGVHCENSGIIEARSAQLKAQGVTGPEGHPRSRPDDAEAEAIHRLLVIAGLVDVPVIVVHLSTQKGMEEIRQARARGQKVYVESCPQYLLLEESRYQESDFAGAKYVCSPPLRRKGDQAALWEALARDEIDTISTDHCSFTMQQKEAGRGDFSRIPGGMPGVEERLSLMYSFGVAQGRISLPQLVTHLAANPARLYGMYPRKGTLQVGSDADLVLFDPEARWTMCAQTQHTAAGYTPYEGWQMKGRVQTVYLRGHKVAQQGKLLQSGLGQYIHRGKGTL